MQALDVSEVTKMQRTDMIERRNSERVATAEISLQLVNITRRLDDQDKKYDARRVEDDARDARAHVERDAAAERLDLHGRRTIALETKWEAFFGDQGAFKQFVLKLESHDAKLDKMSAYLLIGVGILLASQFLIPLLIHK